MEDEYRIDQIPQLSADEVVNIAEDLLTLLLNIDTVARYRGDSSGVLDDIDGDGNCVQSQSLSDYLEVAYQFEYVVNHEEPDNPNPNARSH